VGTLKQARRRKTGLQSRPKLDVLGLGVAYRSDWLGKGFVNLKGVKGSIDPFFRVF